MTRAPFKPMLATPSTGASNRRPISLETLAGYGTHAAEEKLDGVRAIVEGHGTSCTIWNRNGVDITQRFPEIARQRLGPLVLDGEIVAASGTFLDVLTRDKQTSGFTAAAQATPCRFVAFDLLAAEGQSLIVQPYRRRRLLLTRILGRRRLIRPVRQSTDVLEMWDTIIAEGGEGIIVKALNSVYLPGERASTWVKFKATQRLTAVATGYVHGKSRDFGAMTLALIDEDRNIIPIGRVGSGWSEKKGAELQARLDAGEPFLVEVEALNRGYDNTLRFPVFRHESASDKTLLDASIDQLELLPRY